MKIMGKELVEILEELPEDVVVMTMGEHGYMPSYDVTVYIARFDDMCEAWEEDNWLSRYSESVKFQDATMEQKRDCNYVMIYSN